MRHIASILLIALFSFGTIFSPLGNFSCADYVPELYARCVEEDPEVEFADFFFEHLLNLEHLVEFIENEVEDDDDDDEPYNYPYQLPQTVIQTVVVVNQPIIFHIPQALNNHIPQNYSLYQSPFKASLYTSDVFRPPAV